MKYNLDGQRGPAGEINPDNLAAGPYIYDSPPGLGDNKGLTSEKKPVDPEQHKTKQTGEPLKGNAFDVIKNSLNNLNDISDNPVIKSLNFTPSQRFNLGQKLGVSANDIKKAQQGPIIGQRRNPFRLGEGLDPISQLQFETDYINNFVANRKKILEEEAKGRDTRTLEQKETDYIKEYLQTGVLGPVDFKEENITAADLAGDTDYITQLNQETDYIKNYLDNKVSDGIKNNKSTNAIVDDIVDDSKNIGDDSKNTVFDAEDDDKTFTPNNLEAIELNNVPVGAEVWDVDGTLYLAYAVPGAGDLYTGSTIWMAYDVVGNDLFEAGLLTAGFEYKGPNGSPSKSWFDSTAVLAGNTNQIIGMDSDPFASFVETYKEEALLRPWLLDNEFIELQAEAALENRKISKTEWQSTSWYQDPANNQARRDWMDIELSDPAEAQRQRDDLELYYKNQLQGLGVNNVPDGLIQWVTNKNITGFWSDLKTAEQLQLFADPYKTGERDIEMSNFIATSGFGDVDRTAAREKEVVELYRKWLGPSLGALTQQEVSSIAGRLRDDPDYEDALVNSLKQSRLAAFSNYTNPELTYEDIARPWRNLTTSVWGQNADETQGWWQEMVKSNDYSTAQTTLREKGLEQNINQVSVDASQALQNALGQGSISQTGVNV